MPPKSRHPLDKNVSPNWKPPASLAERKPGMPWSDRLWHWLVSLGGVCVAGFGVVVMAILHAGKLGGLLVGVGLCVFALGFPSEAQRKGYRE